MRPFSVSRVMTGKFVFEDGFDVFFVAVGANHNDARAESWVHAFVGDDCDGAVYDGNDDCFADVLAVPLVVGVHFDGDACGDEFGA